MRSSRSHIAEVVSALQDRAERERYISAVRVLKEHLIHKREIPNGRDFLFVAREKSLHDALKDLRDLEQQASRFLLFDYAEIEGYFLLRIVGRADHQSVIDSYFELA